MYQKFETSIQDGMVIDPLRAVHTVKGNSAKEILSLFWDTDVRLEWELTIETCKVCEVKYWGKIDSVLKTGLSTFRILKNSFCLYLLEY